MATGSMTKAEREAFLADVHVAVLAVDEPGRGPMAIPVWYLYEGERRRHNHQLVKFRRRYGAETSRERRSGSTRSTIRRASAGENGSPDITRR
jgi:nitroimidazol reductase NimA-like FMN-containing flavoprotein (pyridoxamine 5'-phosphate oxidase superfamily)